MTADDKAKAADYDPFDTPMWEGLMKWKQGARYRVSRAAHHQMREMLLEENLDDLSLEDFNTYIWRSGETLDAEGNELSSDDAPDDPEEFRRLVDEGQIQIVGNRHIQEVVHSYQNLACFKDMDDAEVARILHETLQDLLYGPGDHIERLERVSSGTNGFGSSYASFMLNIRYPEECALYNKRAKAGLQKLAELLNMEDEWECTLEEYEDFNNLAHTLLERSNGVLKDMIDLDGLLHSLYGLEETQYWKVAQSLNDPHHETAVDRALEEGFAAIGWAPDEEEKDVKGNIERFNSIQPGDYIAMHVKGAIGAVGRVTRPYYEIDRDAADEIDAHYFRRIDVDWLTGEPVDYGDLLPGAKTTLTVVALDPGAFWQFAGNYESKPRFRVALNPPENWRELADQSSRDLCGMIQRACPAITCSDDGGNWRTVEGPDGSVVVRIRRCENEKNEDIWVFNLTPDDLERADFMALYASYPADTEEAFWLILPMDFIAGVKDQLGTLQDEDTRLMRIVERDGKHFLYRSGSDLRENLVDYEGAFHLIGEAVGAEAAVVPDISEVAAACYTREQEIQQIVDMLRDKKQMIFYGPPGTGKTYVAQEIANYLAQGDEDRLQLIQFHPSYTYEDFMQGIKPESIDTEDGTCTVDYPVRDGVFKSFCDRARGSDQEHVFIIDEINRGNIPKIFGELMYLLEYREKAIELTYSSSHGEEPERFTIPENVLIIGTMNTADRSIALVDFALRRRFAFYPFYPDDDLCSPMLAGWLEDNADTDQPVEEIWRELNRRVKPQFGRDMTIGHSYFMKEDLTDQRLQQIWRFEIMPLLEEYMQLERGQLDEFELERIRAEVALEELTEDEEPDIDMESRGGEGERDADEWFCHPSPGASGDGCAPCAGGC